MREARPWVAPLLVFAALCVAPPVLGLAPGADGTPIPGGDFEEGFEGWVVERVNQGFGDHKGTSLATVVDTTDGGDADVARLEILADAAGIPGGSAHKSAVSFRRQAVMTGEFLQFKTGAAVETTFFGNGGIVYRAEVVVRGEHGAEVRLQIGGERFQADMPCGYGAAGFGVQPWELQSYDLTGQGFQVGETVEIEVIWTATVVAAEECDAATVTGTIEVDGFAFCGGL